MDRVVADVLHEAERYPIARSDQPAGSNGRSYLNAKGNCKMSCFLTRDVFSGLIVGYALYCRGFFPTYQKSSHHQQAKSLACIIILRLNGVSSHMQISSPWTQSITSINRHLSQAITRSRISSGILLEVGGYSRTRSSPKMPRRERDIYIKTIIILIFHQRLLRMSA